MKNLNAFIEGDVIYSVSRLEVEAFIDMCEEQGIEEIILPRGYNSDNLTYFKTLPDTKNVVCCADEYINGKPTINNLQIVRLGRDEEVRLEGKQIGNALASLFCLANSIALE